MSSPALLLLLLAPLGPLPQDHPLQEARDLLAAGKPQEAESAALALLPVRPYDAELFALLMDTAEALGDTEAWLRWGKWLYWAQAYGGQEKEAKALAARLEEASPEWDLDEAVLEDWRKSVQDAADQALRDRQYRAAGYLLGKLLDLDPRDEDLNRAWNRLLAKAGSSASGGAFVADSVRRRSRAWLDRVNRLHASRENPFRRKTAHYEIITNISYEFFETASVVMEEMYDFYREIYGYRKKSPRMKLYVWRKRSDFDKQAIELQGFGLPLGVLAWFSSQEMTLSAYDPSENGTAMAQLWSSIFHEASHQFMYLLCEKPTRGRAPTWLNEGTASYFEGCEVKPDGTIVKNKPSMLRVREWESIESSSRRHSLEDLIKQDPRRSYDGSYYSYGWALVYFLLNYEDEQGRLIYREPYLKYLHSYTRKGPKDVREHMEDGFRRAVKFFVEEVNDPEVPDWDAFEDRWRRWTRQVVKESKAGPEFADTLQERVRTYLGRQDWERALIAAEQADDKRPEDPETYRLLAEANLGAGREGEALYWMIRHWELAWQDGDEERAAAAEAWLLEHKGEKLVEGYCRATRTAAGRITEAMDRAVAAGHPVLAMLFGSHAIRAFGLAERSLMDEVASYRELTGHDLRVWLRAFDKTPEDNVERGGTMVVQYEPDGVLVNTPEGAATTRLRCDHPLLTRLRPPFAIRGTVVVDGKHGAQIVFGITPATVGQAAIDFHNGVSATFFRIDPAVDTSNLGTLAWTWKNLGVVKAPPAQKIRFLLEVDASGKGTLVVNDEHKGETPVDWTPERLTGGFSVETGDDTVALFQNLEVRLERPFWPVAPRDDDGK